MGVLSAGQPPTDAAPQRGALSPGEAGGPSWCGKTLSAAAKFARMPVRTAADAPPTASAPLPGGRAPAGGWPGERGSSYPMEVISYYLPWLLVISKLTGTSCSCSRLTYASGCRKATSLGS